MIGNINKFIRNGAEIAIRGSTYFQEEGIEDFEIVALDFIDDQYNVIAQNLDGRFQMLVLTKHKETSSLTNHTAFTVVANPHYWTMDAMYDGGASIHDGEIWAHNIFYGSLTREKATAWIECALGVKEVA